MPYFMKKAREPISSYTHFCGAILFGVGAILLFLKAFAGGETDKHTLFSLLAFGCSITALYSASAIYHFSNRAPKFIYHLRKLDHSMIYILIAGTYTPILLTYLEPPKGAAFTAVMWIIAAAGIVMKLCWFHAPRWLHHFFIFADGLGHPGRCINLFPYEYRRFVGCSYWAVFVIPSAA